MKRLSPELIFDSTDFSKDLAKKSVSGGLNTLLSRVISFFLQIGSTMILARLLTPNDFGLIGMVTVVINFVQIFKEAGLSTATVQKDEITQEQISMLFWVNVFTSIFLGLFVCLLSPLIASFYAKPELTPVAAVLSISFILSGIGIQHSALLRRHMYFGTLAAIQIVTQFASIVITIILALNGCRYWALIGGSLSTSFINLLLTYFFCPWKPGKPRKKSGAFEMLKFGGDITAFNFINYFSRNADNILIGRFIGADALGLYTKAYQVVTMPLDNIRNPISTVALPVLSSLKKKHDRFRLYYGEIVFILASISMPIMAFSTIYAREVILLVFGSKWIQMTDIFMVLSIVGFIQPVTGTRGLMLVATGQTKLQLILGTIAGSITVIGFCVGIRWGIFGVAMSYLLVAYAVQYPMFYFAFRNSPCSFEDLIKNCWYIAVFSWVSVLISRYLVTEIAFIKNTNLLLPCGFIIMITSYFSFFIIVAPSRKRIRRIYHFFLESAL